ncbi:FAD-binding and (Fe-S)-binding domain-containing protein [Natronorubrum bangense]|uniref:D-lactate dehydrogenase (cytochrome) n=2 Tax=Natronorubrum bangense TaxID=61858 RepID=L9WR39_9EURY|nr:FAD-binding and (Fe-S)-binding domain-containing protein [Natronorubrum bangense]ELY51877.1 FAD linked oxidase domain-containing protein [Natronorubrum bangense JCM 10635]QCC54893.1 FAD-binding oxidoreductase [Natronorubrum bangense]
MAADNSRSTTDHSDQTSTPDETELGPPSDPRAGDPAADPRADYDYVGGDIDRPDLVSALRERIDGEVRFDEYSRRLYATDASAYEMTPVGVVLPESTADIASVVTYCAENGIPVLPRGGGTSLAGQAVNEAVVLDLSAHMGEVCNVTPDERRATVQAGAVLADLNDELEPYGLKFAPDPAAGNRSTIGGAIGNNSTGAHSLQYGKTDAYVEACEVVLADGSVERFGEVTVAELRERADPDGTLLERIHEALRRVIDEEADAIREVFPQLKRNVSGYNLDRLVAEAYGEPEAFDENTEGSVEIDGEPDPDATVNLARVFAGSEGTLGVVTAATVSLEPVPETTSVALLTYREQLPAMADVDTIVRNHDPAAIEAIDDVLLDLARDTEEFANLVDRLPAGTETALLVEFYADSDDDGREQVDDLLADRLPDADIPDPTADGGANVATDAASEADTDPTRAFDALEAHDPEGIAELWKLRKSAAPILLSRTSDAKHISFIEDTAVPTENLAEYVADFQQVLEENNTFASFYAHAGPGCMHMRPLVDTKSPAGLNQFEAISDAVTDLVVEYGGSVSGEHGDGRARTQWNRKLYGEDVWKLFRELKTAFDPDWLLNPGNVCGDHDMTEHLRFSPDYEFEAGFEPALEWDVDNGMQGMVELCHGCGGCRGDQETTGGVMCPTYRAVEEESLSTRGRANMLRAAMNGELEADATDEEFLAEVMDLCIGCKGCARDCPSEVDMAKLKAEVEHANHQENGSSLRAKLFANIDRLNAVGSALAPVSNWATSLPGAGTVAEKTVGIARERDLPTFASQSFEDWFESRGPRISLEEADRKVMLVPDTYTNYNHPRAGKAAVQVLETAGVHVRIPENVGSTGRPAHSKGFLDISRERARTNVDALAPAVEDGWEVVLVEPSDAVMFQSDYLDLLTGRDVERVAVNTYGVMEYLERFDLATKLPTAAPGERLTYHGHCHQKATKKDGHAATVLETVGYEVDALDSGCCGMAGSFGYEAEHYSLSRKIGEILFDQVDGSDGETVVAPGASCRTQLSAYDGCNDPPHPIEKVSEALSAT